MMTADYARLLSARFEAVDPTAKSTYRYLWTFIYPQIFKAVKDGEYKTVIASPLTDEVTQTLRNQKYHVLPFIGKRMTEISWEQ